ncbi:hypothetical protein FACS189450_05700 [Spirochaetia bacterium]|nr:hypothetical protein FACS189450_05700 [Spirochaetia bacterium]
MIIQDTDPKGLGKIEVNTLNLPDFVIPCTATYTSSGTVLLSYKTSTEAEEKDYYNIAVINDDGTNFRNIFSGIIPKQPKSNGIRFMVFQNNKQVLLGDYVLECSPSIDDCTEAKLVPVVYPWEMEKDPRTIAHWSEIIIAPDNEHICWTILRSDVCPVGLGILEREKDRYVIAKARIISSMKPFEKDEKNPGYFIPQIIRGGEVKQFVRGGTAISLVGAKDTAMTNSVVQDLCSENIDRITNAPGYDETTIFSPDERLGIVMSSRGSPKTDPAIFGLMPRPHPYAVQGMMMTLYLYAVAGVRTFRQGNIGPVLIDIERSMNEEGYQGVVLNDPEEKWVYCSPMSWHPSGKKAMWPEVLRGSGAPEDSGIMRIRIAELLDYQSRGAIPAQRTPDDIPYGDKQGWNPELIPEPNVEGRIAAKHSGYIEFKHIKGQGFSSSVEARYINYSDDGKTFYNGYEKTKSSLSEESVYEADLEMSGVEQGEMKFRAAFSRLSPIIPGGAAIEPPKLLFEKAEDGKPKSYGHASYRGITLKIEDMRE